MNQTQQPPDIEVEVDLTEDTSVNFFCGTCGGHRVAGSSLRSLNTIGGEPAVNDAAVDLAEERMVDEGKYVYFCMDCDGFKTHFVTDDCKGACS